METIYKVKVVLKTPIDEHKEEIIYMTKEAFIKDSNNFRSSPYNTKIILDKRELPRLSADTVRSW